MLRSWVWFCALALIAEPGFQITTFPSTADDTDQPYGLYVPRSHDPSRPYPLVVMLHGSMSDHRTDLKRLVQRPTEEYIVIAPHARGSMGYAGLAERDVYEAMEDVKRRFKIDEDRMYLTGIGTGGGGAFAVGLSRPSVWAAIAPVSAILPSGIEALAVNASNVPWKVFQGAADPLVRPEQTRAFVERLRSAGASVEYVEFPRVRHNAWDLAYRADALFGWFSRHRRNRYPAQIRFVTDTYRHAGSDWLRFVKITPGERAEADARFTSNKRLDLHTSNVDALELDVAAHPMNRGPGPLRVRIDGKLLAFRAGRKASLSRGPRGWVSRAYAPKADEKMPGLEGPAIDILAGRHIYVYGTLDGAAPDQILGRKREAEYAADWDRKKNHLLVSFDVKADADVTPKDRKSSHLVLFGNRHSNEVIRDLEPHLPIHLSPAAADYGLLYIIPTPEGRYALVNSGLPWWTRVDSVRLPAPFQVLERFGDFALYRGKADQILVEGRFDNQWRLKPEHANALRNSGVVAVRP